MQHVLHGDGIRFVVVLMFESVEWEIAQNSNEKQTSILIQHKGDLIPTLDTSPVLATVQRGRMTFKPLEVLNHPR